MSQSCPKCNSPHIYQDMALWVCPECSHEWSEEEKMTIPETEDSVTSIKDANGSILQDGDSVVVIKDLKVKGSSNGIKGGLKIKNIRLHDGGDGHNITCKIEGIGTINLKSEYVRKS